MTFANPRPLRNPLVVRCDHLLQICIRQQLGRNICPNRTNLRSYRNPWLQRQTQSITSLCLQNTKLLQMNRYSYIGNHSRRERHHCHLFAATNLQTHQRTRRYSLVRWLPSFNCQGKLNMRRATHCARNYPLPLLPSGPGGVGGITSRRTRHTYKSTIASPPLHTPASQSESPSLVTHDSLLITR
jgi:hypothetical protein